MFRASVVAVLCFITLVPVVLAGPVNISVSSGVSTKISSDRQCKEIKTRKEWRTLANSEKKDFLGAVQCLQSISVTDPTIPAAKTYFDLFQGVHIKMALDVHYVGQFLVWHRYFLRLFETALQTKCGYTGAHPYWDWTIDADAGSIASSPIFDLDCGFGGDGKPGTYTPPSDPEALLQGRINPDALGGCIQDGPFFEYKAQMGPGLIVGEHCLTRKLNEDMIPYLTTSFLKNITDLPTYEAFSHELEGNKTMGHRPHDAGHIAVSGEMSNFFSSPVDPLFFLHHGQLDRLWFKWQHEDPDNRMYEVGGPSTLDPDSPKVNLDFVLNMLSLLGPNITVSEMMDTELEPNCYKY